MILSLNSHYVIRNELGCSYLIRRKTSSDTMEDNISGSVILLPPVFGFILGQLGQSEIGEDLDRISKEINVRSESLKTFILQLTSSNEKKMKIGNSSITFPPHLIVERSDAIAVPNYQTKMDFTSCDIVYKRPDAPTTMNIMVTTKCSTDCSYCYAKRCFSYEMSSEEICDIISECHSIGVINLSLTGGDIFAKKGWQLILKKCKECDYVPFLSTKTPLSESSLLFLQQLGYTNFQFSLDSSDAEILCPLLSVKESYLASVDNMLSYADQFGFSISIRTVLTRQTVSEKSIKGLHVFLSRHDCIKDWIVTPAFFSEFKEEYTDYEVSNDALKTAYSLLTNIKSRFPILFNKIANDGYRLKRYGSTREFASCNQKCNANTFSMSILPSGKCTICEMLYEKDEFCIGNVLEDSILNIWNSKKALKLYMPNQQDMAPASPCHSCGVFNSCKACMTKRICYVDIAKTHQGDCLSLPDPRCPKAETVNVIL